MYNFYGAQPVVQIPVLRTKVNQESQTVRLECRKCDSVFTSRLYLQHHEVSVHNHRFICPFCESFFSNKPDYATHVMAHTEKRLIRCGFCKKVFYDVDEFTIHSKMHTESSKYRCDKCPAMFPQLAQLRKHSAIHVNRKFIHTIPKFKPKRRRILCSYTNPSVDNSNNPPANNERNQPLETSPTAATLNEAPTPLPCGQEDSNRDTAQEPGAGGSRSHDSRENSLETSASFSNKKRKKKEKRERDRKKMKASKKVAKTDSQTLLVDGIGTSTSQFKRVTRQQNRLSKNKEATDRTTETDSRELSEDNVEATSAREEQIPPNSVFRNTRSKRAETEMEIEDRRLSEDNTESTTAPEEPTTSTLKTGSSEDQQTDIEIRSTARKQVLKRTEGEKMRKKSSRLLRNRIKSIQVGTEGEKIGKKPSRLLRNRIKPIQVGTEGEKMGKKPSRLLRSRIKPIQVGRVLRSRLQKYQNAELVTEARRYLENGSEITSASGRQVVSSNQEVLSSEDQETDAGITSTLRNQVLSQLQPKRTGKKRGGPSKNKCKPTQPERCPNLLQRYQQAKTVTESEAGTSSNDNVEIRTAPEQQIPSLSELLGFENPETDAEMVTAPKKPVLSRTKNDKTGRKHCPLKRTTETITQTETNRFKDHSELNSVSVEPSSSVTQNIFTTLEPRRDDVQVNSATQRQPLSPLKDQNVVHRPSKGHSPKAPEQTFETNSSQPRNNNSEEILVNESIPLSSEKQIQEQENQLTIIDLTYSPPHDPVATTDGAVCGINEATSFQKRQLLPAKSLEKIQKPRSFLSSGKHFQKASTSKVSIVRSVSGISTAIQFSNSTQRRITVLKPVASSKPSAERVRPKEVTSIGCQTSTNHLEIIPNRGRPIYESIFSNGGETTETVDIAAKSSTSSTEKGPEINLQNADSVYTFEEENVNQKATTSNIDNSGTNKRRRSELWRFFMTASPSKKKAKTASNPKRKKSVHFYACSYCIREFPNSDLLNKHELIHKENRGFSCNLCGGVFGGHGNLISHKKLTHNHPSF